MKLAVARVRRELDTQSRVELNHDAVTEYGDAMLAGSVFPPIVVFFDGEDHWLADGFHRCLAADAAGVAELEADVREGTKRDAVLYSVTANNSHGVRRSFADRRRAVQLLLADPEWRVWSDREIARRCQVSHPVVASERRKMPGAIASSEVRFSTQDGSQTVRKLPSKSLEKSAAMENITIVDEFPNDSAGGKISTGNEPGFVSTPDTVTGNEPGFVTTPDLHHTELTRIASEFEERWDALVADTRTACRDRKLRYVMQPCLSGAMQALQRLTRTEAA